MADQLHIARCLEANVDTFITTLNDYTLLISTDENKLYTKIGGSKVLINISAEDTVYTSLNTSDNDMVLEVGGYYVCNTTNGTFNINIPQATIANENKEIYFIHLEAGDNLISRLQFTAYSGQTVGGATSNSLSLRNSITIVSDGSNWFVKNFSNDALALLTEVDRNNKKIDILNDYGFHLTKDGELVIGDLSIDGSWRMRTEGVYLQFDRAISGIWELGVQTIGASVETDNFILESTAGRVGFRDKDGIRKSLLKASIDGQGAVLGNVDGRVGFVSDGELINVFPNNSTIEEVVVETRGGTFSPDSYSYISNGVIDEDILSYGGTFWSNAPASKYRISVVNVDGFVMAETQAKPLYNLNEDMIPVVVGENKFKWLFPVALLKGVEYTIQVYTSNLIGVELNPDQDDMAFTSRRQTIDIGNVTTSRRWRSGDSFSKGDEIFVDILQADYNKDRYGHFVATEDFIASTSIDQCISTGRLRRVDLYPGTYADNGDGYNFGWGNIGINNTNPIEKLDVVGNVKAIEFIGDGSRLTGVTTTGSEMLVNKNLPNGYPGLNSNGQVNVSVIPAHIIEGMTYLGEWDANINVPILSDTPSESGDFYIVSVAGSMTISGITPWHIGDHIVSNGVDWEKLDNIGLVTSVNGKQGVVIIDKDDVGLDQVDNTSDLSKPISIATQNGLDLKSDITHMHSEYEPIDPAIQMHITSPHANPLAEVNVQADWNEMVNTEDSYIKNKPIIGIAGMDKAVYDPTSIEADVFDRANHTGTQLSNTISDLDLSQFATIAQINNTTGYANYLDSSTVSSPRAYTNDTLLPLLNDKAFPDGSRFPNGVTSYWDSVNSKFTPDQIDGNYAFSVNFKVEANTRDKSMIAKFIAFGAGSGGTDIIVQERFVRLHKDDNQISPISLSFTNGVPANIIATGVSVILEFIGTSADVYDITCGLIKVGAEILWF